MDKALYWMLVSCAFGSLACAFASLAVLFADTVEVAPAEPASGAEALAVVERDEGAEGNERLAPFEPVGWDEDAQRLPGAEGVREADLLPVGVREDGERLALPARRDDPDVGDGDGVAAAVTDAHDGAEQRPVLDGGRDADGEKVPVGAKELPTGDGGGDNGRDSGGDGCECGCRGSDCGCVHAGDSSTGGDMLSPRHEVDPATK